MSRKANNIDVLKAELIILTKSRRRRDFLKANGEGEKISDAPQARQKKCNKIEEKYDFPIGKSRIVACVF